MRRALEQPEREYPSLLPVSERGAEVRKMLTAVATALLGHPPPEQKALQLLFEAELETRRPGREGEPLDVGQRRADLAEASERGAFIKQYLDRALIAFDELGPEDHIGILSAFDGRPLTWVSLPEVMPDLPPPHRIPFPGGAPGEVLSRIHQVLGEIGGAPGYDNSEQRTLRNVLVTALSSGSPRATLERPDWPIFVSGTRSAEIMQSIKVAVAAFDALADTDRRTVLRWIEHHPRLTRVTYETRRHFTEYGPDIRNKLLAVPRVKDATVNIDPAGFADVVVTGGDDQAIFDALLASVPAGVDTRGDVVGSARDSQGTTHPMRFSRSKK
jgi:hypothetical protein